MKLAVAVVVVLGVWARGAAANDDPGWPIGDVAQWVLEVRTNYRIGGLDEKKCPKALALMRAGKVAKSGNKALAAFGGVPSADGFEFTISLPNAEKLCKEAAFMNNVVLKDYTLFYRMGLDLWELSDTSLGEGVAAAGLERADQCVKAVDAMLGAGVSASLPYVILDRDQKTLAKTVGELKPKLCEVTRTAAKKYTTALDDKAKTYEARLTKAGLSGDKLHWFKHYDGQVFLAGAVAPSDPKKYAAANVWFAYIHSSDADRNGNHLFTVRRYQFTGAKLAKKTERTYKKPLTFKSSIGSVMK